MNIWYNLSAAILQILCRIPVYTLGALLFEYRAIGSEVFENIPRKGIILMANHASQLDPVFIGLGIPMRRGLFPLYAVALSNSEYQHIPFGKYFYGGFLFKIMGAYPAHRKAENLGVSLVNHVKLLELGRVIEIFPEGSVTRDGNLRPARAGVAYLAHVTGVPVVPVYVSGNYNISFASLKRSTRKIVVKYGEAIYFKDYADSCKNYTREEYKQIAERMFGEVKKLK